MMQPLICPLLPHPPPPLTVIAGCLHYEGYFQNQEGGKKSMHAVVSEAAWVDKPPSTKSPNRGEEVHESRALHVHR